MKKRNIVILFIALLVPVLTVSCISTEDMGKFDILKQERDKAVEEFKDAEVTAQDFLFDSDSEESLFRPPSWIIGKWYNEEFDQTVTFTENDFIYKKGKSTEYFNRKYEFNYDYDVDIEIIDNEYNISITNLENDLPLFYKFELLENKDKLRFRINTLNSTIQDLEFIKVE